eukprot:7388362-Prymnesium_polylepis.1
MAPEMMTQRAPATDRSDPGNGKPWLDSVKLRLNARKLTAATSIPMDSTMTAPCHWSASSWLTYAPWRSSRIIKRAPHMSCQKREGSK